MHADAALSEETRNRVFPGAAYSGEANLLVMPNLDAANIAYNMVKVLGDGLPVGPMLVGLKRPAHIVTESTTVLDLHEGRHRGPSNQLADRRQPTPWIAPVGAVRGAGRRERRIRCGHAIHRFRQRPAHLIVRTACGWLDPEPELAAIVRAVPTHPEAQPAGPVSCRQSLRSPAPREPAPRSARLPVVESTLGLGSQAMDFQERLNSLERQIRRLQIDYERFLSGALDQTPENSESALAILVRDLRLATHSAADGFRLSALEARFNSYREHFHKRVREREVGLRPPARALVEEPRIDPRKGVTVARQVDSDSAAVLFQGLYGQSRTPAVDLESFHRYLEKQVATLRQRTGCSSVRFRLVERDGKMTLRAKPVDPQGPSAKQRTSTPP
jgi:hypothetical protein